MIEITKNNMPKCGEIWMGNLPVTSGSVQGGNRPLFILSNNRNNTYSTTLNVIPLTSKTNKKNLPVHVPLYEHQRYGLKMPSTMLVEQITTVPAENLTKCIGKIKDKDTLNSISKAMAIQMPVLIREM